MIAVGPAGSILGSVRRGNGAPAARHPLRGDLTMPTSFHPAHPAPLYARIGRTRPADGDTRPAAAADNAAA